MFAQLYQNGILKNPKTVFLLLIIVLFTIIITFGLFVVGGLKSIVCNPIPDTRNPLPVTQKQLNTF